MQCDEFEARVNLRLDRRLRPETDDRLLAHAQGCEACREALAAQEFLLAGVEMLEVPELSPDFARRAVSAALADSEPARRGAWSWSPRWLALSGLAAAVAVVVVSTPFVLSLAGGKSGAGKVAETPLKPARPSAGLAAVTKPRTSRPTPTPNATGNVSLANLGSGGDYRTIIETLPNQFPEVQRDALETVEQIRPITTSFGVAVGLIRNTLPRVKDEPPRKPQAAWPLSGPLDRTV